MCFYTTYDITDHIPLNDHGYVLTMDGKIHSLKYKFSHAYVVCLLFKDRLKEYNLSLENIDIDNAAYDSGKFQFNMPCIRIARYMPLDSRSYEYDVWYNKHVSKEMMVSLNHIMHNIYGIDGYETVCSPNQLTRYVGELIRFLKNKLVAMHEYGTFETI